ncbi:MAG: amidohydrolase family protein [Steroidobacteraceae bacterium]
MSKHRITRRNFVGSSLVASGLLLSACSKPATETTSSKAAPATEKIFDTHAHLISGDRVRYPVNPLDGEPVNESYFKEPITAERYVALMQQFGVTRACAVQRAHIYGYDNSYILDSAVAYPQQLAPVVVVDAQDAKTPDTIAQWRKDKRLAGIRLAGAKPEDTNLGWFTSDAALKTWAAADQLQLPVCIIFFATQLDACLPALKTIAQRFPNLPIVIDHIGVPHGANYEVGWAKQQRGIDLVAPGAPDFGVGDKLLALRETANINFKLTTINFDRLKDAGLDYAAFTRHIVDVFGAERLMWGSDIGQSLSGYAENIASLKAAVASLNATERAAVMYGTAARVYAEKSA